LEKDVHRHALSPGRLDLKEEEVLPSCPHPDPGTLG
jgi:hypothetical protein